MLILEKKLWYNHGDIMVREQTSIAEKIVKLFPYENIVLNKQLKGRKPDIQFKDLDLIVEADEGDHEDDDTDAEKEREDMLKRRNFKTIKCNQNDPGFDINKCLGEIISYVTKLREKKAVNEVINKIAKDWKNSCSGKIWRIKTICQKHFATLQRIKNTQSKIRPIKIEKQPGTMYCLGCKDFTHSFRPQEEKMTNKVLREKSNCFVCQSNKSRFLKQKHNSKK